MGAAARLSDGGAELCRETPGACQGDRPWPEAGTRSGAKVEAARGKEEGSLSLVTIEVCVENTDGLVSAQRAGADRPNHRAGLTGRLSLGQGNLFASFCWGKNRPSPYGL